jgi:hypothetical protein
MGIWMWWLAGPALALLVFVISARTGESKRLEGSVTRWVARRKRVAPVRKVPSLPRELGALARSVTDGDALAHYELVGGTEAGKAGIAFLSLTGPNALEGSGGAHVVMKLAHAAPTFTVRPLPLEDGERVSNTGIEFRKHPEFMAEFLAEGQDPRAVGKFLSKPLREALLDWPRLWLSVAGKAMTLSVYGPVDEDELDLLVATADVLFAEHGARGGPSLVGEGGGDDDEADAEDEGLLAPA